LFGLVPLTLTPVAAEDAEEVGAKDADGAGGGAGAADDALCILPQQSTRLLFRLSMRSERQKERLLKTLSRRKKALHTSRSPTKGERPPSPLGQSPPDAKKHGTKHVSHGAQPNIESSQVRSTPAVENTLDLAINEDDEALGLLSPLFSTSDFPLGTSSPSFTPLHSFPSFALFAGEYAAFRRNTQPPDTVQRGGDGEPDEREKTRKEDEKELQRRRSEKDARRTKRDLRSFRPIQSLHRSSTSATLAFPPPTTNPPLARTLLNAPFNQTSGAANLRLSVRRTTPSPSLSTLPSLLASTVWPPTPPLHSNTEPLSSNTEPQLSSLFQLLAELWRPSQLAALTTVQVVVFWTAVRTEAVEPKRKRDTQSPASAADTAPAAAFPVSTPSTSASFQSFDLSLRSPDARNSATPGTSDRPPPPPTPHPEV
jgi:hypothetical protein